MSSLLAYLYERARVRLCKGSYQVESRICSLLCRVDVRKASIYGLPIKVVHDLCLMGGSSAVASLKVLFPFPLCDMG